MVWNDTLDEMETDNADHRLGRAASNTKDNPAAVDAIANDHFVFGIREAKGLEFSHLIVLDFFQSIPPENQDTWKWLLTRSATVIGNGYMYHFLIETKKSVCTHIMLLSEHTYVFNMILMTFFTKCQ